MSANSTNGWGPIGLTTQLPAGDTVRQQANAQAGQGQAVFYNSAGNVALNDGATPGLICAGVVFPDKLSPLSTTAGASAVMVHQGMGSGCPASTESGDGFTAADVCAVAFDAGEGVPGKLSNFDGNNRSLLGIVFGVDERGYPRLWAGPQASTLARSLLISQAFLHGSYQIADAAASTTTAERAIPRASVHGVVTSVKFVGAAVAADNTDYVTVTIAKRGSSDSYASATTIATYDSRAANQGAISALTPASFALSAVAGALDLLEDDILTIVVAKGGSGKTLTGVVLVNGKAI